MGKKYVYHFSDKTLKGDRARRLLGGKGANLAEMTRLGLPIPPGFTVTTEACNYFLQNGDFPQDAWEQIMQAMERLEKETGKKFGKLNNPLLVSCRSGAAISMPGMMDTILNIGMNHEIADVMSEDWGAELAHSLLQRLVIMFAASTSGVEEFSFESAMRRYANTEDPRQTSFVVTNHFMSATNVDFPSNPVTQLRESIVAVFRSWNSDRARAYRASRGISDDLGTAVTIQVMVLGNANDKSATGVVFSRNPANGDNVPYGEYLLRAQGEDIVSGMSSTLPFKELREVMPERWREIVNATQTLERHYRDMQDVEWTVESDKLWILQTRNGKRTTQAAIKIAVDMANEGLISKKEAAERVLPNDVASFINANSRIEAPDMLFGYGNPASPGIASGIVAFSPEKAIQYANEGSPVILMRYHTRPEDLPAMLVSQAFVTFNGGITSHAAVVARELNVPCVVSVSGMLRPGGARSYDGTFILKGGEEVTVDANSGAVFIGKHEPVTSIDSLNGHLSIIQEWWQQELGK